MAAIDLTSVANVKSWLAGGGTPAASSTADPLIQDCITAFSLYALRACGRGPADGSVPAASPFCAPVSYTENYDGTGTPRLNIRNWPIVSVDSVTIDGVAIPQSGSPNTPGWLIDSDASYLVLRGGASGLVATFQNFRSQYYRGGAFGAGWTPGLQNVTIVYTAGFTAVPIDLDMLARKVVALNFKRTSWIGQRSQQMANGAGTVSYNTWEMDEQDMKTLRYYKRRTAG